MKYRRRGRDHQMIAASLSCFVCMFVERSVSYLETLRIGAVGVVTGLAVLHSEIKQVESTDNGDEGKEDILPGLTDILKTTYANRQ